MVQRFAPLLGGLNQDLDILLDGALPKVTIPINRPQARVQLIFR
jgi:hypothetical protein